MANGSDGSITFDTALDNSGFQRGANQLEASLKKLQTKINGIGQTMGQSIDTIAPAFQQIGQHASSVGEQIASANSRISGAYQQTSVESAAFGKQLSTVERSCATLGTQLERMGERAKAGFNTNAQMTRFQSQVQSARDSIVSISQQLSTLGQQRVSVTGFEEMAAAANKVEQSLFRMYSRRDVMEEMGVKNNAAQWKRLEIQIRNAEAELTRYERSMAAMRSAGTSHTMGADVAQYQQINATLRDMATQLTHYEQLAAQFDTVSGPAAQSESALKAVDRELRQKPKDAAYASNGFVQFGNTLRSVSSTALKATGSLMAMPFKAVGAGAKTAVKHLSSLAKNSAQTQFSTKGLIKSLTSLKRMLISRIKETTITMLMHSVRDAMNSLAKYSKAVDGAFSSLKNSMKGLAGNVAVSFGNLVSAIAPAMSTVINWISKAISYLNAFFALLSGKSVVTVAKKQTDSYASSLGGAASAAKELKNEVYGFDELNKASSTSDSSGGGSGGVGNLYEDVPISSLLPASVADYFNQIKAAILSQDWEGVGGLLADGLNGCIDAVDQWILRLEGAVVQWSSNIARVLNGMFYGLDWYRMGATVAHGLNLILNTINTFLTTLDFTALGAGIGTSLNGLFNQINWPLLGAKFGNGWNALVNTVKGFVLSTDWASAGASIGIAVQSWFDSIDWAGTGVTINAAILGLFDLVNAFMASIDWRGIGAQVARIIDGFDIVQWGTDVSILLSTFVTGVYDAFTGFIQGINWAQLGTDIWNAIMAFIQTYDWAGIAQAAYEYLGSALGAATAFVASLGAEIWKILKQGWDATKTYFTSYFEQYGGDIWKGLAAGIVNALAQVGQWIYDNVFTPFVNGFKSAFGIASPSTVMQEMGGYLIDGLLAGIKATWETLQSWFSTALSDLTTAMQTTWTNIQTAASTAWENLHVAVTTKFTQLKTFLTNTASSVQTTLSNTWESVKTTATTAWENLKTTVSTKFNNLKTSLASVSWTSIGSNLVSGVKSGISSAWSTFSSWVTSKFSSIISAAKRTFGIHSPSKVFAEIGEYLMYGLSDGVGDSAGSAVKAVSNVASAMTNAMQLDDTTVGYQVESGLLTAAQAFSGIVDKLYSLAQICTSAEFRMPQIAVGTVIPYKVRTVTTGASDEHSTALQQNMTVQNGWLEDMYFILQEMKKLQEIANQKRLFIDGRDLYYAVRSARKSERMLFYDPSIQPWEF